MSNCNNKNTVVVASDPKEAASEQQRREGGGARHEQSNRMDAFPWVAEFRAMSRLPMRPGCLVKLIRFFNKNVSSSVGDCYKKSSRAAKLKDLVREALLLFMYFHRFEQPQDQNRAVYLEQMSDLLAVYVDLELIASKRQAEPQPSRISARLVSSLCLCLENSTEHLLDTLIKVQLVNETYSDILDPVISKLLKLASPSPKKSKLDGVAYVRYLLVYRLWKRLHINLAARKNIVGLAIERLESEPPSDLPDVLVQRGVLPSSQNNQSDRPTTRHYLCQSYDLRNACVQFIKYSRSQGVDETLTNSNSSSNSSSSSECSERDPRHLVKRKRRFRELVLIDLTNEPITRVIRHRTRPRIGWLESVKRNLRKRPKINVASKFKEKCNKLAAQTFIATWQTLLSMNKAYQQHLSNVKPELMDVSKMPEEQAKLIDEQNRKKLEVGALSSDATRETSSPTTKKLISYEEYKKRTRGERKSELKDNKTNEVSLQVKVSATQRDTFSDKPTAEQANNGGDGDALKLLQKSSDGNSFASKQPCVQMEAMDTSTIEIQGSSKPTLKDGEIHERPKFFHALQLMSS